MERAPAWSLAGPLAERSTMKARRKQGGPLSRAALFASGGEGIRTPVRDKLYHSVYARSPPIEVSGRWPVGGPLPNKSARVSPAVGRHTDGLAQIFDTHAPPRAGCIVSTATLTPKG